MNVLTLEDATLIGYAMSWRRRSPSSASVRANSLPQPSKMFSARSSKRFIIARTSEAPSPNSSSYAASPSVCAFASVKPYSPDSRCSSIVAIWATSLERAPRSGAGSSAFTAQSSQ